MINVASVFKVLQSCGAGTACRKDVTRFFIKRTVFLSRNVCCGSQKQQVRDAQMSLHNCNTFGNITLKNSNKFIDIVTLRHNNSIDPSLYDISPPAFKRQLKDKLVNEYSD